MKDLYTVAIVGRPNVGKSSLMNRIVGKRHAIVDSISGVTRDRNYATAVWNARVFNLVDTGGLDLDDSQSLMRSIRHQAEFAIEEADAIIFLCDGEAGLVPDDKQIFNYLRKIAADMPLYAAVNKLDSISHSTEVMLADFYELGADKLYAVSALHGNGVADLLDDITEPMERNLDKYDEKKQPPAMERIAIVGRPNVGKSLLFNKLIRNERSIVDDVPGVTRDTILYEHKRNGKTYTFIDTAGLRRPNKKKDTVEFVSALKTQDVIESTDISILVLDASSPAITMQDKRIAGKIVETNSACIIVWNKWDLFTAGQARWDELIKETREAFPQLSFAPIVSASAMSGLRVDRLYNLIDMVRENGRKRISDAILKEILFEAVTIQPPPSYKGREMRLFKLFQKPGPPIVFRLKASAPKGVHFSYQRYLLNHIMQEEAFEGWPVKLEVS